MAGEQKKAFIVELIRDAQTLASVADKVADQENEYFDAGYNGGGADAIADADLAAHDMTAAEFTAYITLIQQLNNFMTNAAVTAADYISTLNKMRRAPGI